VKDTQPFVFDEKRPERILRLDRALKRGFRTDARIHLAFGVGDHPQVETVQIDGPRQVPQHATIDVFDRRDIGSDNAVMRSAAPFDVCDDGFGEDEGLVITTIAVNVELFEFIDGTTGCPGAAKRRRRFSIVDLTGRTLSQ
jgi:hypothetical protein